MRLQRFSLSAAVLVLALPAAAEDANEALDRFLESAFEEYLVLDPSVGAQLGDPRYRGRITVDLLPENREGRRAFLRKTLKALDPIARETLDDDHRIYLDAVRHTLESALASLEHPKHLLPLYPGFGLHSSFAQVGSGSGDLTFETSGDYEVLLERVGDFETWIDAAIANLRQGMERGIVHPRSVVERVLGELKIHAEVRTAAESVFYSPARELPSGLAPEESARLKRRLEEAIAKRIVPAYRRLFRFLAEEYLPASRETISLSDLPGGDALYRSLVRFYTTTDLTPDEIFDYGDREIERILGRIRSLLEQQRRGGPGGGWVSGEEAVLAGFAEIEKRVRKALPRQFGRLPQTPFEVRPVEAFRADAIAGAFYEQPTGDGKRPGIFYVNLSRGGFQMGSAEALFLHEALPGHHMQFALAHENTGLPSFLRYGYFGAFTEGWGLYCESLGKDLGLYRTVQQQLGRLGYELGRASRLVADVGIHHKGWTRREAESYLRQRDLNWAVGEIDRYAAMPAQALSYKIGERQIQELRARAKKALRRGFDPRAFHDAVLAHGPLPLSVLEAEIERWIEAQAKASE